MAAFVVSAMTCDVDLDDRVRLARGIVFDLGTDQLRADVLDRVLIAYGWLAKGGRLGAVADELRAIADILDLEPAGYLRASLARLEYDLRRRAKAAA